MKEDFFKIELDDILAWERLSNINIIEIIVKKGGIWEFHKNDADPFPSNPHGHNRETGEKLDIYTGIKFNGKLITGKLRPKVLQHIQNELLRRGFSLNISTQSSTPNQI